MKYWILLTVLMVIAYFLGFVKSSEQEQMEWMSKKFTTIIKGFSILTVVWAHSSARLGINNIQFIAGIGVALFLICSGYGLEVSYQYTELSHFWRKKILKVCLPFWGVELVGLLITGQWSIKTYVLDSVFLRPATSYGWFMRYIIICYLVFYIVKLVVERIKCSKNIEILIFILAFMGWYVIESIWFVNGEIPFLEARQMLSFPCGILLARYSKVIREKILTQKKSLGIFWGGIVVGSIFMLITQFEFVKQLPYIVSNGMALLTVLPLGISVLALAKRVPQIFNNKSLYWCGTLSYEVYLIHVFTLRLVKESTIYICSFLFVTIILGLMLHVLFKKIVSVL